MIYLRSVLYSIFFILSSVIVPLMIIACGFFPLKFRLKVGRLWARANVLALKYICGLTHEVEGYEHFPKTPCIVMSKHQSTWDTLALVTLFAPHVWVLKKELFYVPVFGWALWFLGPIAIDRKAGRRAIDQIIQQGKTTLANDLNIIIFPEGTRVLPRVKCKHGVGGAILAEKAQVAVLPVAHNAGEFWPRRNFLIHPGVIQVRIGPLIETKGKKSVHIKREVEAWINTAMVTIDERYDQQYPDKYKKPS